MNGWPAVAVSIAGLFTTGIGVVGANYVVFRFFAEQASWVRRTNTPKVAALQMVFRLLSFAALAAVGLSLLLLGFVVAGNVVAWAPLAPLAMIVVSIPGAMYARTQLRRLGK